MNSKRLAISGLYLLLSILNTLAGFVVVALMMGSDFIVPLIGGEEQHSTGSVNSIFLNYVIHPATGTLYMALMAWLIVYQNKIKQVNYRLAAHLIFLLLSTLILLKAGLGAVNVYG
jgi:hypothetical protein